MEPLSYAMASLGISIIPPRQVRGDVPRKLLIHRIPILPHIRPTTQPHKPHIKDPPPSPPHSLNRTPDISKLASRSALLDTDIQRLLRDLYEFPAL
jgi:hypothetical protein